MSAASSSRSAVRHAPFPVSLAGLLLWLLAALVVVRALWSGLVLGLFDGNVAVALVSTALVTGLLALCAYAVPRGSQAARIVAMMLLLVTGLGGVSSALAPSSFVIGALGAIGAVASFGTVVLLVTAPSRAFFRRRRSR